MRVNVRSDIRRFQQTDRKALIDALDRLADGEAIDIRGQVSEQFAAAIRDRRQEEKRYSLDDVA